MKMIDDNKFSLMSVLNKFGPFLGLLLIYGLLVAFGPDNFGSAANLETIARQTSIVGIAALGMTLVIILGGIDLSVGSIVALGTVIAASVLQYLVSKTEASSMFDMLSLRADAWMAIVAVVAVLVASAICGVINGLIITKLKVVPFIVTLGTLLLIRGTAKGLANQQKVDAPFSWLNQLLAPPSYEQRWILFAPGVWIMIILALLVICILKYTRFGRHIYAIGSNEQAARLCGIAVEKVKLMVYITAAWLAGIAGILQFSRLSVGDPTVASGMELDVIAAVVIGGGSLSGGEGSVTGTIVGALIMTVIRSGCSQIGLPNWIQEIVTGIIIVMAVTIDRMRHSNTK
ncbi:MAG: Monosaccharide-transporting ATPase [Parcubacteria group bacterium GW2011_GWA2_43_17]|nr:MAG: Monosaccharide-transporting ATPase [Parcubacteria group bacterium GW2011_GWA2_43_17]